ncbi:MAG: hypothetical protein Q9173_003343 [Seirophora scorigena]
MANPGALASTPIDDLDDMVYVDGANDKGSIADTEPGMTPQIKNLYAGEKDEHGRFTTTDKVPENLPEPEETDETGRYALLIRNNKCYDGRKSLSIASIVVQSPLLKKVLCWVLKDYPCMAPELDRLEFVSPFRPFVHRWQRLTDALNNESDPVTESHIQLFYDALKKELEVTLEARDDFVAHKTITFNSLWMIFEPGDVVFTNVSKRPVAARLSSAGVFQGRHEDLYRLECDKIYGSGDSFGWGRLQYDIPEFDGMAKIADLVTYPLQYHPRVDQVKKQLIKTGRAYEQLMGVHHKQYQGIASDLGRPFYVNSRIIIDHEAYKCYNPDSDWHLKPLKEIRIDDSTDVAAMDEDPEQSDDSSNEDRSKSANGQTGKDPKPTLTENQFLVCGTAVKGYSLRNKRWLDLFVEFLKDIEWDDHVWDNVVLENDLKDLVFSMIHGHRSKHKGLQSKGLNILLSGSTGVGKTFTVESVAEALHAPLFHVTPADVDLNPKNPDLESPFTDILEMCGRWNAILLFDQAQGAALDGDTLDDDQGRDYSLMLDALDSHSAAFFVTCSSFAEDCMDDRLRSRFHVCLPLPDLTSVSRAQIWQKCLESQKDMSFFANPSALADWTLNGREIANAVIAARTLATNGVIEMKHLERVVPAGKRPLAVLDDVSDVPVKKEKKKKGKKVVVDSVRQQNPRIVNVAEIFKVGEEPPKNENDEDIWLRWGFGAKKEKKDKAKAVPQPEEPKFAPKAHDAARHEAFGNEYDETRSSTSGVPVSPKPPVMPAEVVEVPEQAHAEVDHCWGTMPAEVVEAPEQADAEVDHGWETMPAEAPGQPDAGVEDDWGSFGTKKSKKGKKSRSKKFETFSNPTTNNSEEPVRVAGSQQIDRWDLWNLDKKHRESRQKAVADDSPQSFEGASDPVPTRIPCHPPPPLWRIECRTCVEYEPVTQDGYCKRCGTREGNFKVVCESAMVSASKAARQAKRAEDGKDKKKTAASKVSSKAASQNASAASSVNGDETPPMLDGDGDPLPNEDQPATTDDKMSKVKKLTDQMDKHGLSDRVTTGVLASLAQSRDVKMTSVSLVFHGRVLITDTTLELNYGRRYGLLGENGCGKSTLLKAIDKREYPIPQHVDIYLLNEGAPPSELGALEWVVKEAENEMERLDKLAEEILEKNGPEDPILEDLYERMETMDPSTFQTRASLILTGLGFNKTTIHKKTKDMSGGWRMRVALAKALFVKPSLLLLDDPTAHLDLEACVWLEEYLKKWDRTLVLVSHSMDFLNGVCSSMIDMRQKQLIYYGGNYDSYIKTRSEQETNQMKAYAKQQEEIQHIKKFIASAGTYANLVRQAKSRQKILDKMEADGFIQPVHQDRVFTFRFADVEKLPPPVLSFDDVTFGYSGKPKDHLYENLDLGVDMDSRTALVGPNGVGKSTLLRLMTGKLSPVSGVVARHTHLKLGLYSQHSAEQLDLTKSALDFVRDKYSEKSQDYQYWRQQLGRYGLSGESQTALMGTLSEGQKSRIVFALLAIDGPNMLLLDEPTNGLDIPTIDSLADAINAFSGGVVVVSHDFRLLDKIAKDIMVCEHKTVKRWDGSIGEYKNYLRKKMVTMGQV